MFLIFINQLISLLEQHDVNVKLFADDVKLYLRIVNDADIAKLQSALSLLPVGLNLGRLFSRQILCAEYWQHCY